VRDLRPDAREDRGGHRREDGREDQRPSAHATDFTTRGNFVRMIAVKEEHAQICKKELEILWSDYFKPEHLEKFPKLHDTFWKAAKLCSKNKQNVDAAAAAELQAAVKEISDMFYATKK
jgi:nickel superoxide dismutase